MIELKKKIKEQITLRGYNDVLYNKCNNKKQFCRRKYRRINWKNIKEILRINGREIENYYCICRKNKVL